MSQKKGKYPKTIYLNYPTEDGGYFYFHKAYTPADLLRDENTDEAEVVEYQLVGIRTIKSKVIME